MSSGVTYLADFRLPDYPSAPLALDKHPLGVYTENFSPTPEDLVSTPIGIATILFRWHPTALTAFLDTDAWFSLTWSVTIPEDAATHTSAQKLEIGRVGNQVTFGTLDASGDNFEIMCTFNIALTTSTLNGVERKRGTWVPNVRESMLGEHDMTSAEQVESVAAQWVRQVLIDRRWESPKRVSHSFHVEYAPMDIFGDGIPMNPHWLYAPLDLSRCSSCGRDDMPLNRCGRCGTASYCSGVCQKADWKVHKWVCTMSMEDRGQAIKIAEKGGLYKWDVERTMVTREEEVESENPFFETVQMKRMRGA